MAGADRPPVMQVIKVGADPARVLYLTGKTALVTPTPAPGTPLRWRCGGRCLIEAALLGRLANHECRHGRLPFDRTPSCGHWDRRVWSCSRWRLRSRNR